MTKMDLGEELSIDESDYIMRKHAVYIVNIGGYIGESCSNELRYAQEHEKEIIFHES